MAKRKQTVPVDVVVMHDADDAVPVMFERDRNPGVLAFGPYKPGVIYLVAPAEAARLTASDRPASHRFITPAAPAADDTTAFPQE